MENIVDYNKFGLIEEIAIRKSVYLKYNYTYCTIGGIKEEASCHFLKRIITGNDEDIIERINSTYSHMRRGYQTPVVIKNISFKVYQLVWGRLCILAYFFYQDNKLWREFILGKLEEKLIGETLVRDVKTAEVEIDKYYSDKKEYADACQKFQQNNTIKTEKEQAFSPGQNNTEDLPCLIRTMQEIQDGKISNLNDVSWEQEIGEMVRLCKIMPTKFPPVFWLWAIIGIIEEPTKRMDVLGKIQDAAHDCFDSKDEADDFIRDCDSLVKINGRIREYYLRNDTDKSTIWSDEKKILNGIAHLYSDKYVYPEFLVAIAEDIYCSVQNKEKPKILTLLLRADQYTNRMSMDNIFEFSKALYVAEGFRQLFISGKEDYFEFPTLNSFNWRLRNRCFDIYIDLRLKQIRTELEKNNMRLDEPDDLECLYSLLEIEQMTANRENFFEDFRGSSAYEAMWFRGRKMVLNMMNLFVDYLQKRIEDLKKNGSLQHINYTFNGPVGSVIGNVEHMNNTTK